MPKVELLLPAGNELCLRAAVANGADAVYLGLDHFNARRLANNFTKENLPGVIKYCHERNVKVYVALNILVKNHEIKDYLKYVAIANDSRADAIIIQDLYLIPVIKENFPDLKIHLSTQAMVTNSYSIPRGVDRVIVARELSKEELDLISKECEPEIFVHGALCVSYSGLCLFSSIVGTRSGNRGQCAQPCRQMYNKRYPLSTKDLCLLPKIPELIEMGIASFKIEGRMRSASYVATVARIYRKAIDSYYAGSFICSENDISELKLAFNRELTLGHAYSEDIVDSRLPVNKGIFLGNAVEGTIKLYDSISVGDEIAVGNGSVQTIAVTQITTDGKETESASKEDCVTIQGVKYGAVYRISSAKKNISLGDTIKNGCHSFSEPSFRLPVVISCKPENSFAISVRAHNRKAALSADRAKADIIYYDILREDVKQVQKEIQHARFFLSTPWILFDDKLCEIAGKIKDINPDGVLVGNRGLVKMLPDYEKHLDYSFNIFNDIDLANCGGIPIISPELTLQEASDFKNKNFIVFIHGDLILMSVKTPLNSSGFIDKQDRHFKVRPHNGISHILNSKQLGLFNKARLYHDADVRNFLIDVKDDPGKFVKIYRRILEGRKFDDSKIKKGYTTGHFERAVA